MIVATSTTIYTIAGLFHFLIFTSWFWFYVHSTVFSYGRCWNWRNEKNFPRRKKTCFSEVYQSIIHTVLYLVEVRYMCCIIYIAMGRKCQQWLHCTLIGRCMVSTVHVYCYMSMCMYLLVMPSLYMGCNGCMSQQLGDEVERQGKANKSTTRALHVHFWETS